MSVICDTGCEIFCCAQEVKLQILSGCMCVKYCMPQPQEWCGGIRFFNVWVLVYACVCCMCVWGGVWCWQQQRWRQHGVAGPEGCALIRIYRYLGSKAGAVTY